MNNYKPLRVLQIVGGMNRGGIENFLMNLYRKINRDQIQFDFLTHMKQEQAFEKEIKKLGGKIYRIPSLGEVGPLNYTRILKDFFCNNRYEIVHSHCNAINGVILNIAKKCGIKNRISHSHTSYPKYKFISKIYKEIYSRLLLRYVATTRFACSEKAGKWLYGNKNFKIINNGIDTFEYKYDSSIRKKIREELKLEKDEIVIGHIGRFSDEKNHKFLIEIFKELYKMNKKFHLILVGDGYRRKEIEEKIKRDQNLSMKIDFLGIRDDVKKILQGIDIIIFPSLFEGLPVTIVEAQGSGLKCFLSENISPEVDLGCSLIKFISLNKSAREWADIIIKEYYYKRKDTSEILKKSGYDISQIAKDLENFYLKSNYYRSK